MKFCPECGTQFTTGAEKFCSNCGYDVNKAVNATRQEKSKNSVHVEGARGDVIGIDVSGSGNIIGKEITITKKIYDNLEAEFRNSLKELLALINKNVETLSEEQRKSIKESVDSLAIATEGVKGGQVLEDQQQIDEIKSQQITLADKLVNFVPRVAESIALATPLAPFGKVIGEGTGYFAEWIKQKLVKK